MVLLVAVGHHLCQVVVVGYAHGYGVRIGTTQIALGVVGYIVTVLIPVERIECRCIVNTVGVALGITLGFEQLPSTACDFVGTGRYDRLAQTGVVAGQDDVGLRNLIHGGHTALECQVDVHYMALADRCYVTGAVNLVVVILINNGDNLLLREVEDVALAAHIQRTGLGGRYTVYGEVLLLVGKRIVLTAVDEGSNCHFALAVKTCACTANITA